MDINSALHQNMMGLTRGLILLSGIQDFLENVVRGSTSLGEKDLNGNNYFEWEGKPQNRVSVARGKSQWPGTAV
jgi:hypothetical protein